MNACSCCSSQERAENFEKEIFEVGIPPEDWERVPIAGRFAVVISVSEKLFAYDFHAQLVDTFLIPDSPECRLQR